MNRLATSSPTVRKDLIPSDVASRPARARVRLHAMMEVRPDFTVKAILEDLSKDGFRLRSRVILHAGQIVTLHMPRETVACELRWVDGFEAGGVFLDRSTLAVW